MKIPEFYYIVSGSGVANHCLAAFDAALLNAGIGDFNLLRVSSIVPPFCKFRSAAPSEEIPPGALLPIAYGSISSAQPGVISAAIAIGHCKNSLPGLIMEFSGMCAVEEAEHRVQEMVREGFRNRKLELNDLHVESVQYNVQAGESGAVIAAVPMWFKQ